MIAVLKDLLGRVVPLEGNETKAPRLVIMWIAHHKNLDDWPKLLKKAADNS